jgi:hypothetical protein
VRGAGDGAGGVEARDAEQAGDLLGAGFSYCQTTMRACRALRRARRGRAAEIRELRLEAGLDLSAPRQVLVASTASSPFVPKSAPQAAASLALKAAAKRQSAMARSSAGWKIIGFGTRLPVAVRACDPSLSAGSSTSAAAPEVRTMRASSVQEGERRSQASMFSPMVLPVTVRQSVLSAPRRFNSPRIVWMPPARWMSCMW